VPSTREIRRRIQSVKNVAQITKAMETVAASRMRRAQQTVLATRPYASKMLEIIRNLAERISGDSDTHPLLEQRPVKNVGVVMVTADKGLAGSLNSNLIRRTTRFMLDEATVPVSLVAVGKKGRDYMIRYGRNVIAEFIGLGAKPKLADVTGIARVVMDEYVAGRVDAVYLIYTDFINTLSQRPVVLKLLPIEAHNPESVATGPIISRAATADAAADTGDKAGSTDYIYEPDPDTVLQALLPRFVEVLIYQAVLENVASEQSAKLVAMRNATENAQDLIQDLTLTYNKARQASITKELAEIAGGSTAKKR
jgi:F-type H+-transporting ATPase subunit gamma